MQPPLPIARDPKQVCSIIVGDMKAVAVVAIPKESVAQEIAVYA
jgi:hypothetical protein